MSGIRALRRSDVAAVCELYESVVRSGTREYPAALAGYFERTFLDHPHADPDIPSLVYEDRDGAVVGFLGSHVRRLRVDGRSVRMGCSGQLVADPAPRHRGAGALLMRRYLAGPQELSITDGATDTVHRMWTALGGHALAHASIGWTRLLKPGSAVGAFLELRGARAVLHRAARLLAAPLDAVASALTRGRAGWQIPAPDAVAEELTPEALVEQVGAAGRRLRLYPDYDLAHLEWLFAELDAVEVRGEPVRTLLRDRGGRVLGWYVYHRAPGGISQVLQIAAPGGDPGIVLDHLLRDARHAGSVAVRGRVEPALIAVLRGRACLLSRTEWALVHSADPGLLALLGSPAGMLTRLDGEWWMGHHLLWPGPARSAGGPPASGIGTAAYGAAR